MKKTSGEGGFIVFEGLDGAGTTTQAALLAESLTDQGLVVHLTAEPSPGPVGQLIRAALQHKVLDRQGARLAPEVLAGLFVADRADHLVSEIEPALRRGEIVICDRYVDSSLAYQGVECDFEWIATMNAPMRAPDLTLWLHVDPEVAARRRSVRRGEVELYEVEDFQRRVATAYEHAFSRWPDRVFKRIDGQRCIDEVHLACLNAVSLCLDLGA